MPATTTASTATRAEAFEHAWDDFFAASRRARGRAAQDRSGGLTPAQYHLVAPLDGAAPLACGELALAAGVAAPTASRMLDALVRDGIVTREGSTADRRVVSVALTAKGRRLVRDKAKLISSKRRAVYASLTEDEREQAIVLLGR
ncbi:MAG TPA: MarR family transcriptional regulator, partial [Thermoleophilaceae bacterium]